MSETDNSGVYVVKCQGWYKIGVSGCVSKRLEKLNTASPFKVELVDIRGKLEWRHDCRGASGNVAGLQGAYSGLSEQAKN